MYERSILANGLRIVTNRLAGRDSVGLGFWVRVGARHESKSASGVSHFLEHMLFKGTKNRSTKKIKQDVEGVGGVLNAFTGEESTCYFVKIPRPHLATAFDVLQDMIAHATLPEHEFLKERTVILEEIKMYLDLPAQHVQEVMSELLWPNQAIGRPIAGSVKTVSAMQRSILVKHLKQHYHPGNLLITACGDIDHGEIKLLAERYFADLPSRPAGTFRRAEIVQGKNHRFRLLDKKTEQTHFVIGFHGFSRRDPDRYKLAILNVILGANMSSRLFEEVREHRGLAYEIRSSVNALEDTGALIITAGVETQKAPKAGRVVMRELEKLRAKAVTEAELRRAKDYFLGQLMMGLEDTLDNILWYGERVLYGAKPPEPKVIAGEIEKVSARDVQNIAKRIFRNTGIHLSMIGPLNAQLESKMKAACVLA